MNFFKNLPLKDWGSWVVIIYSVVLLGFLIWSFFFRNGDNFWTWVLITLALFWIVYKTGREEGREEKTKEIEKFIEGIKKEEHKKVS